MNRYEDDIKYLELPDEFKEALRKKKDCLNLTHAACILLAANPHMSPADAARDVCQIYCYLLKLHACQPVAER